MRSSPKATAIWVSYAWFSETLSNGIGGTTIDSGLKEYIEVLVLTYV